MDNNYVPIKDMRLGMKNINALFIVLEVGYPTLTKENREVRTFKVADQTACIDASIWDEPGNLLIPGDIVRLTKGYLNVWRNCLTLYTSRSGHVQKVDEFCMVFNEHLNMSEPIPVSSMASSVTSDSTFLKAALLSNESDSGTGRIVRRHSAPVQPPPQIRTVPPPIDVEVSYPPARGTPNRNQRKQRKPATIRIRTPDGNIQISQRTARILGLKRYLT